MTINPQTLGSSPPQIASTTQRPLTHHRRPYAWLALIAGVVVIIAAVAPPFDAAADRSFSSHMLQHVFLMDVGAPLLAIAWTLVPTRWRTIPGITRLGVLAHPIPALLLSTAALWLWHIPTAYDWALEHEGIHVLEHVTFIVAFMLFFYPLTNDPRATPRLRTDVSRVFYLTSSMLATELLAALITFADHLIYTHYAALPSAGGRSPLGDQHLGGAIMWIAGAIVYGIVALLTLRETP